MVRIPRPMFFFLVFLNMLNGREKVGFEDAVGVSSSLRNFLKPKRLSIPFGSLLDTHNRREDGRTTEHEHFIREIPLVEGALGCALWDGGLVLSRWVYGNGSLFNGKRVLELGCGVGLAGIMAAHWAEHVWLTDYIPRVLDNAQYNVRLNSIDVTEASSEPDTPFWSKGGELRMVSGVPYHVDIEHRTTVCFLDWDQVGQACKNGTETTSEGQKTLQHDKETALQCLGRANKEEGSWWHCATCWPHDPSKGVCEVCRLQCHRKHDGIPQPPESFSCDCCAWTCRAKIVEPIPAVDIIMGAELTYNLCSCDTLAAVVDLYLAPGGTFIEVLSEDRDGVGVFCTHMEGRGFETKRIPIETSLPFETDSWSHQQDEKYFLYSWTRK